ncbi:MAG: thioredoxin family protein [Ignavibacteriales bacterium]|nr:thioredoxin family protein [Ignavibacteriales bacterium]
MLSETRSRLAGKYSRGAFLFIVFIFAGVTFGQSKPKVTFIELGSVNCIPCKQMQPVMKAIEAKFGERVKVIFYDVWTEEQKPMAEKYGIKLIPTQVFLDEKGKEFFRHEGFYPEKEIDKLLQGKGLKVKK